MTEHTPQQLTFIEALRASSSSLILEALAGTGKTTTLCAGHAALSPADYLFVAFAKSNVQDFLEKGLPTDKVKTLNSLGGSAWTSHLGRRPTIDTSKLHNILKSLSLPRDLEWGEVRRAVSLSKAEGLVPQGAPLLASHASRDDFLSVFETHDIDTGPGLPDTFLHYVTQALRTTISQGLAGTIDFDDQLYLPVIYSAAFRRSPLLYVDEAQDLNTVQHRIVAAILGKTGRLVAAGDPHQAIYGFRGAKSDSMSALAAGTAAVGLPLTVSFRCSRAVVEEARQFVPEFSAWEGAEDGEVLSLPFDYDALVPGTDAVLCRNNAPLVGLAFRLLREQKPFRYVGRAFGEGLTLLVKKLAKGAAGRDGLLKALAEWKDLELANTSDRAKKSRILDKADSLREIFKSLSPSQGGLDAIARINLVFDESRPGITLSTGHRAKGREYSRVWWLRPELLDLDLEAERNLAYVITTRAKSTLIKVTEGDDHD